jgi:hypothetical protein
MTASRVKEVVQPWSARTGIESRAWANFGKIWPRVSVPGRPGMSMLQVWVDVILLLSGRGTRMPVAACWRLVHGVSRRMEEVAAAGCVGEC